MLDGFARRIKRLVNNLGREAIYRTYTETGPSYEPVRTAVDSTITLVEFDFEAMERDGSTITENDTEFVVSSSTVISKLGYIVDRDIEYQIIAVDDSMPGDDKLMYVLQCRR